MSLYLDHFGLSEPPFRITPGTEFFFAGAGRGETLEALVYAVQSGEGLIKVVGEVGSGKTMLSRVLMERLPPHIATVYLAVPSLTRDEMLAAIATDLGLESKGISTTDLVKALQQHLIQLHRDAKQVVLVIDEAHAMPSATLEDIRLLSNLETGDAKLLQIVLFGQPELESKLADPSMRQLRERITVSFVLTPLPKQDIRSYVDFRLRRAGYKGPDLFSQPALDLIAEASEGLTRRINIYADKTLLAAYAGGTHTITADHARAAIADTTVTYHPPRKTNMAMVAGVAGLIAGAAIGYAISEFTRSLHATEAAAVPPPHAATPSPPERDAAVTPSPPTAAPAVPVVALAPQTQAVTAPSPASALPSPTPTPTLPELLERDASRLRTFAPPTVLIQLASSDGKGEAAMLALRDSAATAFGAERVLVVPAGSRQAPRLTLLAGPFTDRNDAQRALAALPQALASTSPYPRTASSIVAELRIP